MRGNSVKPMPLEYLTLARKRAKTSCSPYKQVEAFGYDFSNWVSPYTKGAHSFDGFALVLQDWASESRLTGGPDPEIQRCGRVVSLRTNLRLECLLACVLGLKLADVYATNAFPFVKPGGMSSTLKPKDVEQAVRCFTVKELQIARAKTVLALGSVAYTALSTVGIECVHLPHPAARIGGLKKHESAWRSALSAAGIDVKDCVCICESNRVTSNVTCSTARS